MYSVDSNPINSRQQMLYSWQELQLERSSWIPHWQELGKYFMPRAGRFTRSDRNKGDQRNSAILDNTTIRARRILGAGMMSGATSPARPWFRLSLPDDDLMEYAAVKEWLAQVQRLMLHVFARSNTYLMLHQMYDELAVFGTHTVITYDDFAKVIHHYNSPTGEYALATDYLGNVNTVGREFEKTVGETVDFFGYGNCSQTVRNLYDRSRYNALVPIVHMIQPRRGRDKRYANTDARNKAFSSCYIELGREDVGTKFLRESGFDDFPALAPRWHRTGGDVYGESPGMDALGDAKQLQHEQLRKGQGIDYGTLPPIGLPTSAKGQEKQMLPGGIVFLDNPGDSKNHASSLWDVGTDQSALLMDIQDVRQRIMGAFNADLFLMISNSTDERKTATEIVEKKEEKLIQLGPVLERLHGEALAPLCERTFIRMLKVGMLPTPPKELKGVELNVEFISTLAQAQRAIGVNAVDRFVANLGIIAGFKPDVVDKFDSDAWADHYADIMGVDPELIVSSDQVALVRNERAKQQQAAAKAEQAAMEAKAAQSLGAVKTNEPNLATDVLSSFQGYSSPAGTPV